MAIEQVQRLPPGVALLNELDARLRSLPFYAQQYRPLLETCRAYIAETNGRLDALEARK